MKVTVNIEVAEKIIALINDEKYLDESIFHVEMNKIEKLDGMKKMLKHYKNLFDFKIYKAILFKALNKIDYSSDVEMLTVLYINLRRVIEDKAMLNQKLALIRNYDFKNFEKKLMKKLPKATTIEVDIFFAFDALNGATIIDDQTMMINTMFWPSKEENLALIENILLHEYHHIGFYEWVRKYDCDFDEYTDKSGLLRYLVLSILSEGAATYFYNDGDDLYPLVLESHGIELAEATREAMVNRGSNILESMKELENDIKRILASKDDLKTLKKSVNKYFYNLSGEPLDKTIGYHMCEAIEGELGTEKLIECFEDVSQFLIRYNQASHDIKFSEDIVRLF